ncbi:lipopolysaccharide biosynthesis protein, partial [Bacteroides thetaiotaomicron]|nr:lipopolysaccharide biosynthesis protein [Bacteroides thetaiotaomicron]
MSEQTSNMQQSVRSNANTKRIAKNTLVLYVRMFIMLAISLYTSRVILNMLGVDDYGIYNVVGGVVAVLSFLNAAMAGATQRYINIALGKREQEQLNKILSNSIVLHYI